MLGTPAVLRARTAREFQQLRTDADAVPIAAREFSRIEHLLIRVPAYGPGGTTPDAERAPAEPRRRGDERAEGRAGAAAGRAADRSAARRAAARRVRRRDQDRRQDGDAKELVGFRVTG